MHLFFCQSSLSFANFSFWLFMLSLLTCKNLLFITRKVGLPFLLINFDPSLISSAIPKFSCLYTYITINWKKNVTNITCILCLALNPFHVSFTFIFLFESQNSSYWTCKMPIINGGSFSYILCNWLQWICSYLDNMQ